MELAACPFCPTEPPFVTQRVVVEIPRRGWAVRCIECGTTGPLCEKPEQAGPAWNKRPSALSREEVAWAFGRLVTLKTSGGYCSFCKHRPPEHSKDCPVSIVRSALSLVPATEEVEALLRKAAREIDHAIADIARCIEYPDNHQDTKPLELLRDEFLAFLARHGAGK